MVGPLDCKLIFQVEGWVSSKTERTNLVLGVVEKLGKEFSKLRHHVVRGKRVDKCVPFKLTSKPLASEQVFVLRFLKGLRILQVILPD